MAFSAAPTASIVVANSDLNIGGTSLVTFTFSEAVTGFTNFDLTITNGTLTPVASSDGGITWTATFTPSSSITAPTNRITLNLAGVTNLGSEAGSGTVDSNNYRIDTQRPTATIVLYPTYIGIGQTSQVTITFSEEVTGFSNADLTISNGTLSAVSSSDGGITWTATFTPAAGITQSSNVIRLNNWGVADLFGNQGNGTTDSNNYGVDSQRPTVAITMARSALKAGDTSLVTFTFSEAVTGFDNADLTIPNGSLSPPSSSDGGITWTATFTPNANVRFTTNLISLNNAGVADLAGNLGAGVTNSANFSIDTIRPTATVIVAIPVLKAGETALVTITFSEAVAGFDNTDLSVANGTLSAVSSTDGGITWTATFTPTAGITSSANQIILSNTGVTNASGNTGSGTTASNNYSVQTARPTATIVVATPALVTGGTSVVTITFSEAVTGFTTADMTADNGTLSGLSSSDGGVIWTATLTPAAGVSAATNHIELDLTGVVNSSANPGTGAAISNNYTVNAPTMSLPATLADGVVGRPYSQTLSATGGTAPYTFSITAGSLPTGLTLNGATGVVSGTPSTAGTSTFTIAALDSRSFRVTEDYTVTVAALAPDPTEDAEVTGLLTAQVDAARRFADSQVQNFNSRLEQLHDEGDRRRNSMAVRLGYSGNDGKSDEDRRFEELLGKSSRTEASGGFAMHNYAEDKKSSQPAQPTADVDLGRLAVWTGGYVNFGKRDDGKLSLDYTTAGVSGGMDYRFSKSLVAGFGLGYGRDATDIGANGTESRAHAYSGAVYASYQPFKSTYLDGLIGGSWLDLSSKRYETASGTFAMGDRSGTQIFGSITASYEKRDDAWLISPYGRLDFSRSWLDGYTESGSGAGLLRYGSQTVDTVSGIAGLRVEYAVTTDWGTLKPGARIEYVHDFAGSSQVSLGYADTGGLDYVFQTEGKGSDYVTLGASLDAALSGSWTARFDYRTAVGGVGQSHALGLKVGRNF
ncbi:Ig-like domain-containing protein [Aminobacter sp. MET-1]|uniref:Ig-like domain-containing protein n=1 Tax=Aminobacter sp. MET-1 TaxID=2951085 RepID=UPI002269DEDC|nr:Ig-like domain-containing protein [Aminobacter sp. MET-1]MCX8572875.1 Ig-like domain-containing protein [Aminobacter sp. MET-1]